MFVSISTGDPGERLFMTPPPPVALPIIHDDLLIDILLRLPVKSLLRFKCVCKSWKSLISNDPQFAKTHLQRSTTDPNFTHHRLMPQACFLRDDVVSCSVESLFNNYNVLPDSLGYPLYPDCDVIGYSNGLCCLVYDKERVLLWNPSTRLMSRESPSLLNLGNCHDPNRTVFGFGYEESSNTYKAVSVYVDVFRKPSVNVFSFGSENWYWRQVHSFPAVKPEWGKCGELVRGTLNWLAKAPSNKGYVVDHRLNALYVDNYYVIVSFDLKEETCGEFLLPHDIDRSCSVGTTLGALRDCLCVSQNYEFTKFVVWQMMEHGVRESWTRLLNISYEDLDLKFYAYLEPLCMSEKGDILINTNVAHCRAVLYKLGDNRFEHCYIWSAKSWFRSKVYVESLVSPPCLI